jgi:hypothetical protein
VLGVSRLPRWCTAGGRSRDGSPGKTSRRTIDPTSRRTFNLHELRVSPLEKSSDRAYNHSSMTVTVRSFAKINLGLRIGAAREDGFHELLTVYQTIGLHDVIRVSVRRGSGIEIQCADPRVPRDESNTCYRIVEKAMRGAAREGARGD